MVVEPAPPAATYARCTATAKAQDVRSLPAAVAAYGPVPVRAHSRPVILAVPGAVSLPAGTDADGLYDDVNGNGRKDFADVVLFFTNLGWIAANEPPGVFDYTGNGRIDFADVIWLFDRLDAQARKTFTVTAEPISLATETTAAQRGGQAYEMRSSPGHADVISR